MHNTLPALAGDRANSRLIREWGEASELLRDLHTSVYFPSVECPRMCCAKCGERQ